MSLNRPLGGLSPSSSAPTYERLCKLRTSSGSSYLLYYRPSEQTFGGLRVNPEYDERVPRTSRSCELSSASDDRKVDGDRPNVRVSSGAEDVVGRVQD